MTLFVKPLCSLCGRARRALDRARIKYHEVSIHTPDGMARHADAMTGGANGDSLPMLKIGEDCVYNVVTWVKEHQNA